jgi:hypothetical protein
MLAQIIALQQQSREIGIPHPNEELGSKKHPEDDNDAFLDDAILSTAEKVMDGCYCSLLAKIFDGHHGSAKENGDASKVREVGNGDASNIKSWNREANPSNSPNVERKREGSEHGQ